MAEAKLTALPPGPAPRKPCLEGGGGGGAGTKVRALDFDVRPEKRKVATGRHDAREVPTGGKPGAQPA